MAGDKFRNFHWLDCSTGADAGSKPVFDSLFGETDMTRQISRLTITALTTVFVLGLFAGDTHAQVVPFKVDGGGSAPLGVSVAGIDSPHNATGNGTLTFNRRK
jgi:hypothetical protein